jgi:hypothetical protein
VLLAARWGLVAVAWSVGVTQCLAIIPALSMLTRHYELRWFSLLAEIVPSLALYAVGIGCALFVFSTGSGLWTQVLGSLAFCGVMAIGGLFLWLRERQARSEH